ncbi:MAG: 8-oxo-dGTP diphosphatase [Candidatus Buchananbacteria bacterium]
MKLTNLCYIINDRSEVLLIKKKRDFGAGKFNGVGGKVEPGEDLLAAVIREVKEEVGLDVINLQALGFIEFIWPKEKSDWNQRCYIYRTNDFIGEPVETDECCPHWFSFDQIPYDQMWDDDKYWYAQVLAGQEVKKRCYFDLAGQVIKFEDISN